MKRTKELVEISRREFCALAGCLAVAACASDPHRSFPVDASTIPDAYTGPPPTCNGVPAVDVGAPSTFVMNTPVLFMAPELYVVRDAGGLFAVSSLCTHQGAQNFVWMGLFSCPLHGSEFSFNGDVINGPATRPLVHYAMCTLASGRIGVMPTMVVAASTRLVA